MAAYLRLLVQNRLASIRPSSYVKAGKSRFVAVLKVVGFGLMMLMLYAAVAFLEYMLFDLLNGIGQGRTVIGLALLGCTVITLIYGFFHVNGTLFFGRDTSFLAALPLTSRTVLMGKMLMVALGEAGVSLLFSAPLIVGYGASCGAGAMYYLKSLLAFTLTPLIPITVAMLLSFLLIRVSALWKRREGMTTLLSIGLFVAILIGEFSLQNMSEAELTQWLLSLVMGQRSLTQLLLRNMPWLQWASDGILVAGGEGWLQLGLYVLASLAVFLAAVWLLGGSYMKLAVQQAEVIGRVNKGKKRVRAKTGVHRPVVALMWQEVRDVLSVPVYATNCLIGILVTPIMLGSMLLSLGEGGGIADMVTMLDLVPRVAYLAVATGVFSLVGAMSEASSTAVSREGKCHELRKTYPVSGALQLRAKVYMGVLFHGAGVLLLLVPVCLLLPAFWLENLIAAVLSSVLAFLFSLLGVIVDVHYPKLGWKTETEAVKQNFNAMISMLLCFAAVVLLVGVFALFMKLGLGWLAAFIAAMLMALLLDVLALLWLNHRGEKAYYAH